MAVLGEPFYRPSRSTSAWRCRFPQFALVPVASDTPPEERGEILHHGAR